MTYLIDTHILIWRISSDPLLPLAFAHEINNPRNTILLSKASLWEIAIKIGLQKIKNEHFLFRIGKLSEQ